MKRYTVMMLAACAVTVAAKCFGNPIFDGCYADPSKKGQT